MIKTVFAAVAAVGLATPAHAEDWWVASTDHFNIYTTGGADRAVELAVDMERLDEALRIMRGVAPKDATLNDNAKLSIFQYGTQSDIGGLIGSRSVVGFFIARAGGSVAFVPLREESRRGRFGARKDEDGSIPVEEVLFHEYTHYFMYQHNSAAYPRWYSEGFAEMFGTLDLTEDGFRIGRAPSSRSYMLFWLNQPIERLLDPISYKKMTGLDALQDYSYGWLLTAYLSLSPERSGQLAAYLEQLNRGKPSIEAAKGAFGDLDKLQKEVDAYRRGRALISEIKMQNYEPPVATVRKLDDATADTMPLRIRLSAGVDEDKAKIAAGDADQLLRQHPQSATALRSIMEAYFDAERYDDAESAANRLIGIDADSVDARIYLAQIAEHRGEEDAAAFKTMRDYYVEANRLNPSDPRALFGYWKSFVVAGEIPPEAAIIALESAYSYAPFEQDIRTGLAWQLLTENRGREAIVVLGPLVNDPHGGKLADKLSALVEEIEAGKPDNALGFLHPSYDIAEALKDD